MNCEKQSRCSNVLPLTLNSHASNFENVITMLSFLMCLLNQDTTFMINDEETFVCIFTLAFIKDMLQQQINANCKSIEADKDCRFCLISIKKQDNLTYDDINNE